MAAVMIGIDPHKGSHTAVALDASEQLLGRVRVRACPSQAGQLVVWARRGRSGSGRWRAPEGAGSARRPTCQSRRRFRRVELKASKARPPLPALHVSGAQVCSWEGRAAARHQPCGAAGGSGQGASDTGRPARRRQDRPRRHQQLAVINSSGGGVRQPAPAYTRHGAAHPGGDLGNPLNRPIRRGRSTMRRSGRSLKRHHQGAAGELGASRAASPTPMTRLALDQGVTPCFLGLSQPGRPPGPGMATTAFLSP
jgi:hypothetical protein